MNVLFLTHNFPRRPGDVPGSFVLRLALALRDAGIGVDVVAPGAPGLPDHEEVDGIHVDRFRYAPRRYETLAYGGNMAEQVRASWSARFALVGFLGAEFRCAAGPTRARTHDIVHAHWWFPSGVVGTWISSMSHRPLVTTMHGSDVRLARSVAFARPAFRHVLRHSARVTAVSRWLADEASQIVSAPSPTVAPMPVDTRLFSPGGLRHANRLLFVGRLNRQKGIETLLRAFALLRAPAELDIVGDGDEAARLRALAGELGIEARVRWHGALPQSELVPLYRSTTALVVPSVDEGLGLVAVEAQLCRTPVIAFDSGGLRDVVHDGQTGILVHPIEAGALARAIEDLFAMPDQGAALGEAGRLHALGGFAPESAAARYADIYRDALAGAST